MKYIYFLATLFLFAPTSRAQNLVPNSSFVNHSSCPTSPSEIDSCSFWTNASWGTSDYFNVCSSSILTAIPQNTMGYQVSPSDSYTGICTYAPALASVDYHEYISAPITQLVPGNTYKVTIVVSLSDSSKFATNGLGALFTTFPYFANDFTINVAPQIDYTSFGIITDKVNWTTLSKTFVANSAYNHLVIGNFKPNDAVGISTCTYYGTDAMLGPANAAYYFIDSVAVQLVFTAGISNTQSEDVPAIYPNPVTANSTLCFNYQPDHKYRLQVVDINGRIAYATTDITTGHIPLNKNNFAPGIYHYLLRDSYNIISQGKFVVQ